jgi:hypothetical protein
MDDTRVAPDVRSALHSMGYFWSVLYMTHIVCVWWMNGNMFHLHVNRMRYLFLRIRKFGHFAVVNGNQPFYPISALWLWCALTCRFRNEWNRRSQSDTYETRNKKSMYYIWKVKRSNVTEVRDQHLFRIRRYFGWLCIGSHNKENPRPLAYGNTASIKGTTTLTTKPNPLLLVGHIETCRVQYLCLGWWEFHQTSQFRGQRSRSWRNWYIIFDNIAISTCRTDSCRNVQLQYLCLGSWGFQRAKYFQGQSSRSWWNWSAISRLVGEIETWKVQ